MANQTFFLLLFLFATFTTSCSKDDALIENFEGATDCSLLPGGGVCIEGPRDVIPGKTYTYAFKIAKQEGGPNVNKVVHWTVESGQIEIIETITTNRFEATTSVATIKFGDDFDTGKLLVISDRYNEGTNPQSLSGVTYIIAKN